MAHCRTNPHIELLTRIAGETRVLGPARYEHAELGRHRIAAPRTGGAAPLMLGTLTDLIYRRYYLAERRMADESSAAPAAPSLIALREDAEFGRALREANAGSGYLDAGWTVDELPVAVDGTYTVRRGQLSLSVRPDQLASAGGGQITIGATVAVRFPKDRPYAMPGFYAAISSAGPPRDALLVRWYFHLLPAAAPHLIERLTRDLGDLRVRFLLKVLNHPDAFTRPDAAVLYLPRAEFDRSCGAVIGAHQAVAATVRPSVPAFTRPVQPGLSLAEEPPQRDERASFGQHRSRLVARGLIQAFAQRRQSASSRLESVLAAFAEEGISLDAPHLNPGSAEFEIPDQYIGGSLW